MPRAVDVFCDTPRNGHIPRNWVRTMLLTRTADIIINMYCMINSFELSSFELTSCYSTNSLTHVYVVSLDLVILFIIAIKYPNTINAPGAKIKTRIPSPLIN